MTENFYMKYRLLLIAVFGALFITVIYLSLKHNQMQHLVLGFVNLIVGVTGIWFFSVITISEKGLVLYKVNTLSWSEIVSAEKKTICGLPYILIGRRKGFKWWLPLYYVGSTDVQDALRKYVPPGNPILEAVDGQTAPNKAN